MCVQCPSSEKDPQSLPRHQWHVSQAQAQNRTCYQCSYFLRHPPTLWSFDSINSPLCSMEQFLRCCERSQGMKMNIRIKKKILLDPLLLGLRGDGGILYLYVRWTVAWRKLCLILVTSQAGVAPKPSETWHSKNAQIKQNRTGLPASPSPLGRYRPLPSNWQSPDKHVISAVPWNPSKGFWAIKKACFLTNKCK